MGLHPGSEVESFNRHAKAVSPTRPSLRDRRDKGKKLTVMQCQVSIQIEMLLARDHIKDEGS